MSTNILSLAAQLSNADLVARVKDLAQREREATAILIAHLAVLDERRLYRAEGCSSMFIYCTQVLHLSEHAAYGRIETARAARKFPAVLEMLAEGSVNLTMVGLLAPHLTPENHRDVLAAARHKTKRQVEELVARLRPQPSVPSSIRKLPTPSRSPALVVVLDARTGAMAQQPATGSQVVGGAQGLGSGDAPSLDLGGLEPRGLGFGGLESGSPGSRSLQSGNALPGNVVPAAPEPRSAASASPSLKHPAVITPLARERYKLQCTVSAETFAKLRLARDLMRHQIPDGDVGQIIDRALTALLKEVAKQKFAATDRPNGARTTDHPNGNHTPDCAKGNRGEKSRGTAPGSRHIPAEVKRAVWLRDGGQCAFVARSGRRCIERGFLEFHHVVAYAIGGESTVDNIQLRCRAHNGYEAELYFGPQAATWGRTPALK